MSALPQSGRHVGRRTLKFSTRMQETRVMGYEEEGRPLRAEAPHGPEEAGLLTTSGSIALGSNNLVHCRRSSFTQLHSTIPAWD